MQDDKTQRMKSLTWLSVVRQATVSNATFAAYALELSDIPPDVLEQVCRQIGRAERGEYEDKWPELGVLRGHCQTILRQRAERREERRRLAAYKPPRDPARLAKFMDEVKAVVARKSMK